MHSCTNAPRNWLQTLHAQAFIFPDNRRLTSACFPTKQSLNPLCPFVQLSQNAILLQPCPLALALVSFKRDRNSALTAACTAFGRRYRCSREGEGTMGLECSTSMAPFRREHLASRLSMLTGYACCRWLCAFPRTRTGASGWSHWTVNRAEVQVPFTSVNTITDWNGS